MSAAGRSKLEKEKRGPARPNVERCRATVVAPRASAEATAASAAAVLHALGAIGSLELWPTRGGPALEKLVARLTRAVGAAGGAAISLSSARATAGGARWGVLSASMGSASRSTSALSHGPQRPSSVSTSPAEWLSARLVARSAWREERPPISPSDLGLPKSVGPIEALLAVRMVGGEEPVVLLFVGEASKLGEETLELLSPLASIVPHLVASEVPGARTKRARRISEIRPVGVRREAIEPQPGEDGTEDDRLRFLGAMTAGIAHDFGNLVTTMLGTSVLLEEQLGEATEELRRDAASLTAAARRAASLVRDLLRLSRGGSPWDEATELDSAVASTTDLLDRILGARFTLRVNVGSRSTVRLATHQVERLIMNLALNARDAMGESGTIDISTFRLEPGRARAKRLGLESGHSYAVLRVEDAGPGMSEEVLKRAADPFFTTKSGSGGTGLGLATCSLLATRAGGGLVIESEPGKGTRVEVWLAVHRAAAAG